MPHSDAQIGAMDQADQADQAIGRPANGMRDSAGIGKTYRDAYDMGIAVASAMKRSALEAPDVAEPAASALVEQPATIPVIASPRPSLKGRLSRFSKRAIRRIVRPFYRGAKPFVRPITGRIRRNLLETFQREEQQHFASNHALLRELTDRQNETHLDMAQQLAISQTLLRDVIHRQDVTRQQLQSTLAQMRQEMVSRLDWQGMVSRLDRIETYSAAAATRIAIPTGPDETLVRTQVGYVVCSSTDQALIAILLESGDLERGTRRLIERLLQPGQVFIDVGANIGLHTLAAARAMQGTGRIVAFEPYEPTLRLLRKSVFINGFAELVEARHAAVSDHVGSHSLYLGMTSGHHSLFPLSPQLRFSGDSRKADTGADTSVAVETPMTTLDAAIPPDLSPDLIKIDVEGAELEVIQGARALIERTPQVALIAEFGASHLARTGHTTYEWLAEFAALGLDHQVIEPVSGALESWTNEQLEQVESANLFFARPAAAVWKKARAR